MIRRDFLGAISALATSLLAAPAWAAPKRGTLEVTMYADFAALQEQLAELAARLEALDPAESLFRQIRGDIEQGLAAPSDELICLEGGTTIGTNKLLLKVKLGPVLQDHLATLRAVQGDIFWHGDLRG